MTNAPKKPSAGPYAPKGDKIMFVDHHFPDLLSGNYDISAVQTVSSMGNEGSVIKMALKNHQVRFLPEGKPLPTSPSNTLVITKIKGKRFFRVLFADPVGTDHVTMRDIPIETLTDYDDAERQAIEDFLAPLEKEFAETMDAEATGEVPHDVITKKLAPFLGVAYHDFRSFTVAGPRYGLGPKDVLAVFPPEGNAGDHSNVLPHIILTRSTLPWERESHKMPPGERSAMPWMGLLIFDDVEGADKPTIETISLGQMPKKGSPADASLIGDTSVTYTRRNWIESEGGEDKDDKVQVMDVRWSVLEPLLPTADDLPYLAHVRQDVFDDETLAGDEHAIVIANRLPRRGGASMACLVSFENRFAEKAFDLGVDESGAAIKTIDGDTLIRLVVLKSWRFSCPNHEAFQVTSSTLVKLAKDTVTQLNDANLKQPAKEKIRTESDALIKEIEPFLHKEYVGQDSFKSHLGITDSDAFDKVLAASRHRNLSFKSLLMQLDKGPLRLHEKDLPHAVNDETTKSLLAQSMVALPHRLRNGAKGGALYHGPLTSGALETAAITPIARSSDELLRIETKSGLMDVSYAAAWELGRSMMLADKQTSLDLFNWKRAHASHVKQTESRLAHLPFNRPPGSLEMPVGLQDYLYELALLRDVPFSYLVPDPAMVPSESIRFFKMDTLWVEALLDGSFSVGRTTPGDLAHEQDLREKHGHPYDIARKIDWGVALPTGAVSGALIRSEVIEGWPHLQVDARALLKDSAGQRLTDLRTLLEGDKGKKTKLDKAWWDALTQLDLGLPVLETCWAQVMQISTDDDLADVWRIFSVSGDGESHICDVSRPKPEPDTQDVLHVHLPLMRQVHLSKSFLMVLFHGNIDVFDVHLKPEVVHFGVGEPDPRHKINHYKELRNPDGSERENTFVEPIPWKNSETAARTDGVVNISALANGDQMTGIKGIAQKLKLAGISPWQFALQMIEGVDRVRFMRFDPPRDH
jgi:hypothetical protein